MQSLPVHEKEGLNWCLAQWVDNHSAGSPSFKKWLDVLLESVGRDDVYRAKIPPAAFRSAPHLDALLSVGVWQGLGHAENDGLRKLALSYNATVACHHVLNRHGCAHVGRGGVQDGLSTAASQRAFNSIAYFFRQCPDITTPMRPAILLMMGWDWSERGASQQEALRLLSFAKDYGLDWGPFRARLLEKRPEHLEAFESAQAWKDQARLAKDLAEAMPAPGRPRM